MDQSVTSHAAQVIVSLIPIVGIVFGGLVLFFMLLWHHNEVKLQVKTGCFVPKAINGKAVSLVFAIIDGFSYTILGGLVPCVIGVSLLIFYRIYPEFHKNDKND